MLLHRFTAETMELSSNLKRCCASEFLCRSNLVSFCLEIQLLVTEVMVLLVWHDCNLTISEPKGKAGISKGCIRNRDDRLSE